MKTLCRVLKLLPPAFAMRIWLQRKYGIKVKPSPWGGIAGFVLAVLPYAFTAALSVRVESDCRLLKYFLPYGKMKRLVYLSYRMRVGNDAKDHGAVGVFRAIMPYGLVLWWDAETSGVTGGAQQVNVRQAAAESDQQKQERARAEQARMDRLEAMSLRYSIITAGRPR